MSTLRKKLIIKILKEHKRISIDELLEKLNETLRVDYNKDPITRRTFDRDKKDLLETGYDIVSKKSNGNYYFVLESCPVNLTKEEELTFPLLLGLLNTEKKMNAVDWLKEALMEEFHFSKKDLDPYPYFVHVQPTLNAQDKLLILAGEIIEYMKKGQAIKFLYDKNGVEEFKQVAPLQIRYYDNRYYMLGSAIDDDTYELKGFLQTYSLDKFVEKEVFPAVKETEEETEEIFYDFEELFKRTDLEKKLNNSLGIWYDWKGNDTLKNIRFKFTDWAMGIIENKQVHPSQKTIEKTKDYLIIEISVWDNQDVLTFIKRFDGKCERLN